MVLIDLHAFMSVHMHHPGTQRRTVDRHRQAYTVRSGVTRSAIELLA